MAESTKKRRRREKTRIKPLLSNLNKQDTRNGLMTPSSRHKSNNNIYKINKPMATFFNKNDNRNHMISNVLKSNTKQIEFVNETSIAKNFIRKEMTKLAYEKYIISPFAFIDGIENGSIPLTEFVYLNEISPYNLEIISSLELLNKNNYYTLSSKGITHFNNNNNDIIFIPLNQWQREYYLFTSIMKISFFKKYREWKCFKIWKKSIQKDKIKHCNNMMNNNLFILDKHLRKSLFEIRKICCDISEFKLFNINNDNDNEPISLNQFIDLQKNHRSSLKHKLNINYNKIKIYLLKACQQRLNYHLIKNGFNNNSSSTSHAKKAAIRTECRSLTKFIKMIDNFVQDSVLTYLKQNIKSFLKHIQNIDNNKSIFLLNLDLDIENKCFTLKPKLSEFQDILRNLIYETISIILEPHKKSLYYSDIELSQFHLDTDHQIISRNNNDDKSLIEDENLIDLEQLLINDNLFINNMKQISNEISNCFDQCSIWIDSLSPYLQIYFQESPKILSFDLFDADKFEQYLSKYNKQISIFNTEIVTFKEISILKINCLNIKNKFIPIPKQRLKYIQEKLPEMAKKKCLNLMNELISFNENIKTTPITINQFVIFKENLKTVNLKNEEIEYRLNEINDLFLLINEQKIRISKDITKSHGKLHQIRSTLITNISISDSTMDDLINKFTNFMKNAVPKLIKDIADLRTSLNNIDHDLNQTINYILKQDQVFTKYESLDIDITQFQQSNDKKDNNNGIENFQKKKCKEDTQTEIKTFIKLIETNLNPTNTIKIIEYLGRNIFELKRILPIIEHLSSDNLKEKLNEYNISKEKDNNNFTLNVIFEKDLLLFERDIIDIFRKISHEKSLIDLLNRVILTEWLIVLFIDKIVLDQ